MKWLNLLLLTPLLSAQDAWRDPNDPTRVHRLQTLQQKSEISTEVSVQKFQPDQSLRLILRQLLLDLQIDYDNNGPVKRDVQVKISGHSMTVLSKYLKEDNSDFPEDREAVRSALSNVFSVLEAAPDTTWQDTFLFLQPFIITLNLFILPAAGLIVIRSIVRPRNFWVLVFSTILVISMYSGYNKKYQEAESRKFAQYQKSSHDACAPEGLLSRMVEIVASPFQYRQKSECLKYIESQTISIFHEISLIEVFSETISSGFFAFMSASAKHLNHFFRDLYDGAPILAQIVMTVFLILMVGTVKTPFFSYEPIWLTFCSSSIGKIAGWLEGPEEPRIAIQMNLKANKEVKRIEKKERNKLAIEAKVIECPTSEREDADTQKVEQNEPKSDEGANLLGESSEDEEQDKDSETEWNEAINSSSLSESSF